MIRLRGHHLICLHFFNGEGFQPEFILNLREIIKKTDAGKAVIIWNGPDDICRKCPYLKAEACLYNEHADEEIREMDRRAQVLLNKEEGDEISWQELKKLIPSVFAVWSEQYCNGCDWKLVCEKNAWFSLLLKMHNGQ